MNFDLSEEQKMFKEAIRGFAEKEIAPLVEEAEGKEKFPRQLLPRMGSLGYLGVSLPAKYKGAGMDKTSECIWIEEMGRICAGIAFSLQATVGAPCYLLRDHGSEGLKQKYMAAAIAGQKMGGYAITEPNAGSDAAAIETKAVRDGNSYVLNGSKTFISNGTLADFITVFAYTDKAKGPRGGMSAFIVDREARGFSVSKKFMKAGQRSADHGELAFEDCRIPQGNLIGEEGKGFAYMMASLDESRLIDSGRALGVAQAAFEAAMKYSQERQQFGQAIYKFQAISFKLANMAVEIEAARGLVYHTAWLCEKGQRYTKEASMCHIFAAETAMSVASEALQIHGGYGYMMDSPVQRYYRDARLFPIIYGTSEIQQVIITRALGL